MQFNVQTGVNLMIVLILLGSLSSQGLGADVIAIQLANEGVLLSDGEGTSVMIDGMVIEPYSVYGGLPEPYSGLFLNAAGPFSGIDLALASHQHHDHNQPDAACKFLQNSKDTIFASSAQVMDLMREKCRQYVTSSANIRIIDPQYGQAEVLQVENARVTVFLLSHGGGKYAVLQNFGHLVEIGGLRVLHVGDADMDATDFERAGVSEMDLDIALIPFWYFQPGPGGDIVSRFLNAPHQVATHIPPGEMQEIRQYMQSEFPGVLVPREPMEHTTFTVTEPPLP